MVHVANASIVGSGIFDRIAGIRSESQQVRCKDLRLAVRFQEKTGQAYPARRDNRLVWADKKMVGATRFERATSSTPWKRATKLRHAPIARKPYSVVLGVGPMQTFPPPALKIIPGIDLGPARRPIPFPTQRQNADRLKSPIRCPNFAITRSDKLGS